MQTNENALLAFFLAVLLIWTCAVSIRAEEPDKMPFDVDCASAVLMDSATGTILYQKNADQALPPASVTKVMTLLLVMEAVDGGNLALDESVSVSPYAASMGGSQVYLEPGERCRWRKCSNASSSPLPMTQRSRLPKRSAAVKKRLLPG